MSDLGKEVCMGSSGTISSNSNLNKEMLDKMDLDKLTAYHKSITDMIEYFYAVEGQLVDMNSSYFHGINDTSAGDNGFEKYRKLISNAMSTLSAINEFIHAKEKRIMEQNCNQ